MHKPKDPNLSLQSIVESAARIKQKNEAVSLGFSFVITWKGAQRDDVFVVENLSEMAQAAKLAKAHRFDYISFKPFLMRASQGAEVLDASTASDAFTQLVSRLEHQLLLADQHQDSTFKVVASTNLTGLMSGAWEDFTKQPKVCHVQALRQVVSPLGVFNCPAHRGVAKARIGSADAWASGGQEGQEGTQRILDSFHACNECAEVTCLYHRLNSTLDKLISSDVDMDVAFPAIPGPRDTFL